MTITRAEVEANRSPAGDDDIGPIHPGEHLLEDFLKPLGITPYRLAKDIGVPPNRISEIVAGRRDISADTALRLARYFGMSTQFWTGLQSAYDVEVARRALGDTLARITPHGA